MMGSQFCLLLDCDVIFLFLFAFFFLIKKRWLEIVERKKVRICPELVAPHDRNAQPTTNWLLVVEEGRGQLSTTDQTAER